MRRLTVTLREQQAEGARLDSLIAANLEGALAMWSNDVPFSELLSAIVDNRGRSCPTVPSGIPLIATNCVRNEMLFPTYEGARFVSQDTYSTWFRGHPLPGDILFVNKATPGRVCVVPNPVDFCIAQDMVALRANPSRVYPKYLFAALRSQVVQERISTMHVGTLIPHFKKGDFDKLLIPVPDMRTQQQIGDIYYELSAKVDLNRRMSETLEATARGAVSVVVRRLRPGPGQVPWAGRWHSAGFQRPLSRHPRGL